VTALTYKAEIFDASGFKESRSVGTYLGMTPTQYASGETQKQGKTSKRGSKELRSLISRIRRSDFDPKQEMEQTESVGAQDYEKKGS
jgi:transposase